ncbi:MAG: glycerophosphodiester phosphodiesterase [Bacteroidia bacterium]
MQKISLLLLLLISIATGCSESQQAVSMDHEPYILGHRGSGNTGYNSLGLTENTLPSILKAMELLDGVEIDIEMSRDSVVYVFHDSKIPACGNIHLSCIPTSVSSQINAHNQCLPEDERIPTLREVFQALKENNYQKFVSLDVKGWFEEECIPGHNVNKVYQEVIAAEIAQLIEEFQLAGKVFVETNYTVVLDEMKRIQPETPTYLLGYGKLPHNIEYALKQGYDGISFSSFDSTLTQENVETLHQSGLKLQLWTPNESQHLLKAKEYHPHFIQTDNVLEAKAILNN